MDNRLNLLRTALKQFGQYGYEGVGVASLVREAGVTKPTMYHYFSSKRGLFSALLDWVLEPLLQDVENIGRQEGTTRELLNELAWRFDVMFEQSRDTYALLFYLYTCPHQSEIQDLVDTWTLRFSESVERLINISVDHGACTGSLVLSLFGSRVHRYSLGQTDCRTLLQELTPIC